jgi:hypothetical protein
MPLHTRLNPALTVALANRLAVATLLTIATPALAEPDAMMAPPDTIAPASSQPPAAPPAQATPTTTAPPPASAAELDAQWNEDFADAQKALRVVRFKHFNHASQDRRRQGIAQLTQFTTAPALAAMLDVYRAEEDDVRRAMADHMARLNTDEALTVLAFGAIHERDPALRTILRERLASALRSAARKDKPRPRGVDISILNALQRAGQDRLAAGRAAAIVQSLGILEAIPALINAQVGGASGGQDRRGTALAYILVGTQRGYVQDLELVVGDGTAGFDPTPGVITEGVVLAIGDAVITSYVVEVHQALVEMTSNISGKDTSDLGYDTARWAEWYETEFPRILARRAAAARPPARPATSEPARKAQAPR